MTIVHMVAANVIVMSVISFNFHIRSSESL